MRLRSGCTLAHTAVNVLFILSFTIPTFSHASSTQVSGVVEGEFGSAEEYDGTKSSDIALATVEIALDSEISEWVGAHIVLLHEEDDTPLEVDQGYIEIGNSFLSGFTFQMGQVYVPFGAYETNLISDPLTLEIGETRESAIVATYDSGFYASFYLFNGDLIEGDADDTVDNMGFNLGYVLEDEGFSLDIGFGYISNLGDSDGLSGTIVENIGEGTPVSEYVPGIAGHLIISFGSLTFISELVAATTEFAAGEVYPAQKSKPSATNLEFAYGISDAITIALALQNTVDLSGVLPESRFLLGLSYQINDATALGFEYLSDSDYETSEPNGTGESASAFTIQLATEF